MRDRPEAGIGIFYTRDSEGHSELAPPQYVEWARRRADELGVGFTGTSETIESMIARGVSSEGDLYIDYGISGNLLSRPGFDAFRLRAVTDPKVSHLFVPRRDRMARPDNPIDAMAIEFELRKAGLTLAFMDGRVLPPVGKGERFDLTDLISSMLDYDTSGRFRRDLAEKLIYAKLKLAELGYSIGGEPLYGFRRWLCTSQGERVRELARGEIVKMPGHHVIWLPTAEEELRVVRRIVDMIETTCASRIADLLNIENIPSPHAGRTRKVRGVPELVSGRWSQSTVRNIATHPLLGAVMAYGRRASGDQLRMGREGPRPLGDGDFGDDGRPKSVAKTPEEVIHTPAKFDPLLDRDKADGIREVVAKRGESQRRKARARGSAPNPLGGRVFDMACGWPMYRFPKRGVWKYRCGLYQNSNAKRCRHNVLGGEAGTRFVLNCLRQRALSPSVLAQIERRLRQLAEEEAGGIAARSQAEADRASLTALQAKLKTVSRNMALSETPDQRQAMAEVFDELKGQERLLQEKLRTTDEGTLRTDPNREVTAAMRLLERLGDLAESEDADYTSIGELFTRTDVRLYLRFREVQKGRSKRNMVAAGVLTLGASPPPVPLYEGQTDKAIIRMRIAEGLPISAGLGGVPPADLESGPEAEGSANVKRGTTITP